MLAIAIGGIIGAILRYHLILIVTRLLNYPVFFGTFLVNITGTFLIGFLASGFEQRDFVFFPWDKFILIGLLGAYTTFSSYLLDTINLWQEKRYQLAINYCLGSLILGLITVQLGILTWKLIKSFS